MLDYLLRFLAGGVAVCAFAAFGDALRPKSFAGLFGAAPSIALATVLITLSQEDARFVAVEARSMVMGAFALTAYCCAVGLLIKRCMLPSWVAITAASVVWFAVALGFARILVRDPMIVHLKPAALRETRSYEYFIRFVLGGAMTVAAGLIASHWGPLIGGLFLAFPAIFPASATLIEKHTRERKEKAGLSGARRGKEAAALDAAGAALGSVGLAAFALVLWLMIQSSVVAALVLATAAWLGVSVVAWLVRRWL